MSNAVDREFRLALWKLHILHHAAQHPVYGLWMLQELAEHGHRLSPGTLYPILARMERRGWLRRDGNAPHARARQAFRITASGRRVLEALRREVTELYEEVVCGREPHTSPTQRKPVAEQAARGKNTTRRKS